MSKKQSSDPSKALLRAPAEILAHDRLVALRRKRVPGPPAVAKSAQYPLILVVENRDPLRVVLTNVLETLGCDVIVALRLFDALSIAAAYNGTIDFVVIQAILPGLNIGLFAHLFRRKHPETRTLFVAGSSEEVLICDDTIDRQVTVLEQPVRIEVVANTVGEMIANRKSGYGMNQRGREHYDAVGYNFNFGLNAHAH